MGESLLEKFSVENGQSSAKQRPASSLIDFVRASGNHKALNAADLIWLDFDPSQGIRLVFASHTVELEGTNLASLYSGFLGNDVSVVKEVEERYMDNEATAEPLITRIHIMQRPGPEESDSWANV